MPGIAGAAEPITLNVCAAVLPQPLLAITETVPLLADGIAVMLLVVEVPLQPEGRVQVYEVAPFTDTIE